jgi:hypothetical protein
MDGAQTGIISLQGSASSKLMIVCAPAADSTPEPMQKENILSRTILAFALLTLFCAGIFVPRVEEVEARPMQANANYIVISEFRTRGQGGGSDEFIELHNPTSLSIDISGWEIWGSNASGTTNNRKTIPAGPTSIIAPGGYYLLTHTASTYAGIADTTYSTGISDDGGIAVFTSIDLVTPVDQAGMSNGSAYKEGTILSPLGGTSDQSYERKLLGSGGNCDDTNNNSSDFILNPSSSNPQNFLSPAVSCPPPTATPTNTNTPTDTSTPTITFTPSLTPIFSFTPTLTPTPGEIIISEVAWAGTEASADDEWIELYNSRSTPLNITGWRLVTDSGSTDVILSGTIPANGTFLLERAHDLTVSPTANQIYFGTLADTGEVLRLRKPSGTVMDTANVDGGAWPAGGGTNLASMERIGPGLPDTALTWVTFNGPTFTAQDAGGNDVYGTPGSTNWGFTVTQTFTPTNTPTRTRTITPTPVGSLSILINEVAWGGTLASSTDEWVELYNTTNIPINITGWKLNASDGSPAITLAGTIPARGYFILASNSSVFNDITVNQVFSGSFSNEGEVLRLLDGSNQVVDTANSDSGAWPAGLGYPTYSSMERRGKITDGFFSWATFAGTAVVARDRNNNPIKGTPGQSNWALTVTITPTRTPTKTRTITPTRTPSRVATSTLTGRLIINEFLARPGFDWNQDGAVDVFDEFIEIKNIGPLAINTSGWKLDDDANEGSNPFTMPDMMLQPGERVVFYGLQTNILLSDGGETVRLLNPSNKIFDSYTYKIARAEDESICRMPDGNGDWYEDCTPTPKFTNTRDGQAPDMPDGSGFESPVCSLPDTLPEPFLIAECRGYGANLWSAIYWDAKGWDGDRFVPENMSKWESFVE